MKPIDFSNKLAERYSEREAFQLYFIVMEDLFGMKKSELQGVENKLSEDQVKILEEAIIKLNQGMPVQHVTGLAFFYHHFFKVTKDTLVPRPETEELVQWVLHHAEDGQSILDIGTGTGCIAITLKKAHSGLRVSALDVSEKALLIARENAENLKANIDFIQDDILNPKKEYPTFDHIVSNPPYIPEKDKEFMDSNVLDYDPELALFVPNNDPLKFYKAIEAFSVKYLAPGGKLFLEIHEELGTETLELFANSPWKSSEIIKDLSDKNRIIIAQKSAE